MNTIFNWLLHM